MISIAHRLSTVKKADQILVIDDGKLVQEGKHSDLINQGLHYNWNKYYDPESGRYSQTDPIGFEGRVNFYSYVENRPNSLIDP